MAKSRYAQIIEAIFFQHYADGDQEVPFERTDIIRAADDLGIRLPKNLGDVLYSFRYRAPLPDSITVTAPTGQEWMIRSVGRAQYKFVLVARARIVPSDTLVETKIPDATPGVISARPQ